MRPIIEGREAARAEGDGSCLPYAVSWGSSSDVTPVPARKTFNKVRLGFKYCSCVREPGAIWKGSIPGVRRLHHMGQRTEPRRTKCFKIFCADFVYLSQLWSFLPGGGQL